MGDGEDHEMEGGVNMADVLMLLASRPARHGAHHEIGRARAATAPAPAGGVFECKTCNRKFSTFQALGGHRTSHRKAKPPPGGAAHDQTLQSMHHAKPKVHECSICGLEFPMGQALGGHMRRHRAELEASKSPQRRAEKAAPLAAGLLCLDLNQLPPMEEEEEEGDDTEFLTLGWG